MSGKGGKSPSTGLKQSSARAHERVEEDDEENNRQGRGRFKRGDFPVNRSLVGVSRKESEGSRSKSRQRRPVSPQKPHRRGGDAFSVASVRIANHGEALAPPQLTRKQIRPAIDNVELDKAKSTSMARSSHLKKNATWREMSPNEEEPPYASTAASSAAATSNGTMRHGLASIHENRIDDLSLHKAHHQRVSRTDEAAYTMCRLCSQKIMNSDETYLANHVQLHATLKRYQCAHCSYEDIEVPKMRRHIVRYHPDAALALVDRRSPEMEREWEELRQICFPEDNLKHSQNGEGGAMKREDKEHSDDETKEEESDEREVEVITIESDEDEEEEGQDAGKASDLSVKARSPTTSTDIPKMPLHDGDEMDTEVAEMTLLMGDSSLIHTDHLELSGLDCLVRDVISAIHSSQFNQTDNVQGERNDFPRYDHRYLRFTGMVDEMMAIAPVQLAFSTIGDMIRDPAELCMDLMGRYGREGAVFLLGIRVLFYLNCGWSDMVKRTYAMAEVCEDGDCGSRETCEESLKEKQQREWGQAVEELAQQFGGADIFGPVQRMLVEAERMAEKRR